MNKRKLPKQEQHLVDEDLQPIYYYEGKVTICLLRHEGGDFVLSRGIAICSPSDQFIKRIGRARALGMAMRAFKHRESWEETELMAGVRLIKLDVSPHPIWSIMSKFKYRSTYDPELTNWERTLINKIILREAHNDRGSN